MEAFLDRYYAIITFGVVFLPPIVGFLVYKKYRTTPIKYFIWFCFFVAFVEIFGAYPTFINKFESLSFFNNYVKDSIFQNSNWWFLIFWNLIGALFYAFYFYNLIDNTSFKKLIKYLAVFVFCVCTFDFIRNIDNIAHSSNIFITFFCAFLIIVAVLLYFVEVLNSDKVLSISTSMSFYIGATILLWHLIINPLSFYEVYFNRSDMDFSIMKAIIYLICNTFMYLTFTFALLWCKPQNN